MIPPDIIQTFLAPPDPLGFAKGDYLALVIAAVTVVISLATPRLPLRPFNFPSRTRDAMIMLAILPVILRLLLLPRFPVPTPSGSDDFGYILLADTLRHFRLANPPHGFPEFFQQIFVLQQPTYSSMFNLGSGIILAIGWAIFGHPWAGVLIAGGLLCALSYWMLCGWITPHWALAGGLLAVMEFGPLSYWTNSYWGGAVSACAGCLVFGSLPRLAQNPRRREAALLGLGFGLQFLTRPYEFLFLALSAALFLAVAWRKRLPTPGVISASTTTLSILAVAGALVLLQNRQVTGKWTTTPYLLYRHQYGVPATFTFQPNPLPHVELNSEQELDYRAETAIHGDARETLARYFQRFLFRLRFYRFFLFAPLYLAVIAFFVTSRRFADFWILLTIALFAFGSNFYPYFYPHYIAAITCLFLFISVKGLERLHAWKPYSGYALLAICLAQFVFWYAVHAFQSSDIPPRIASYESWDFINRGDPQGRVRIERQLARFPGKLLVFVHYAPTHMFQEWIHNAADIDNSRIIWVSDLGPQKDQLLRKAYPDRAAYLLKPDETPPQLLPYPSQTGPFLDVQ